MTWVVELTGVDPSDGMTKTKTFAMGAGVPLSDAVYVPTGFAAWQSASQKIDVSQEGGVSVTADQGSITLANVPNDISSTGPLDALADWAWHGRKANLYWVPGTLWSAKTLVATGTLEQPLANLSAGPKSMSTLVLPLRDPRSALTAPLQPTKFAGSNSGGSGVEGEADIKGLPKPILYGVASNFQGVRVNQPKLIWQLADKAVTILCVRDGAASIAAGVARGTLASLQSSIPTPGTYDYYAGTEGTFVRFGSTPIARVTFDAQEGATTADRTHAQVWKRIRTERCGNVSGDINAATVTACDAADGNEVGFWWGDELTQLQAIDEVLGSLSGYEVQALDYTWSIAKLVAPSGTTKLDFGIITQTGVETANFRPLISLQRVRPNFAPDGAPPYRVNVRWGHNYTVMAPADFLGVATQRLRDKFAIEWRVENATDTTIWNPTALTGKYPNAPELTVSTGYQPGVDGLTCPHAATEATRLLTLYSTLKGQYKLSYRPETTDNLLAGDKVSVTFPQMLSGGPKFLVLQAALKVDQNGAQVDAVVGFQT